MPEPVNVLVLVHGMTTERDAPSHSGEYGLFKRGLAGKQTDLFAHLDRTVEVEWGNHLGREDPKRPDQRLSLAEERVSDLVGYDRIKKIRSERNVTVLDWSLLSPGKKLRESIVQFGLADALYYASADGEKAVRQAVYEQVLGALEDYRDAGDVRLHIVAHSLGVTVAHDFLYGLFTKQKDADFLDQASSGTGKEQFEFWFNKAKAGELRLGTLVSMASQLPLFVMRVQKLVDAFAKNQLMQPGHIGITADDHVQWVIFYDVDDPLGFATRRLYEETAAIKDRQVRDGGMFKAHTGYWTNDTVLAETAGLIYSNATRS